MEKSPTEGTHQVDSGKGLKLAVVVVAMLSALSLLVGLYSVFR